MKLRGRTAAPTAVSRRVGVGLLAVVMATGGPVRADEPAATSPSPTPAPGSVQVLPPVVIRAAPDTDPGPFGAGLRPLDLNRARAAGADTARLLQSIPGVQVYGAGGVSSLPVVNGLADDRVRTQVDGMDLLAACPNHMNPALSYIDPSAVGSIRVYAGIAPVSAGGDSIGGAIQIESAPPNFAPEGETLAKGRLSSYLRSNGWARGANASASWASEQLFLSASSALARQGNWHAARAFKPAASGSENGPVIPGDEVGSSAFDARNDNLRLAWRQGGHLLQLGLARQHIAHEGYPNQRMDMTDNASTQINLRYTGRFDWGQLQASTWQQRVRHAMDMGPDRYFYGFGMPMLSQATTQGMRVQASCALGDAAMLTLGAERQTYVLFDWWPPVGGTMGPNAFWNIDLGRRFRTGAFAELEWTLPQGWTVLAGLRADHVMTDAGPVQGYDNGLGAIWGNDAAAFNAQARRRKDLLRDYAVLARNESDTGATYDLGLARKSRAPNLHQRNPWSTQAMAALMNNFVGDGNGYIGNLTLKPEVAHTVAASAEWRDAEDGAWRLKASAHATHVRDYMDARRCDFGQCGAANLTSTNGFVLLQYVNQPARLLGADLQGRRRLMRSSEGGELDASFALNWLRGRNLATGDGLYNIMPLNLRLALEHRSGGLSLSLEAQVVAAKRDVSQVRNEMRTPGYGLLHLRGSHEWKGGRLDFGIDNLLNRFYSAPLGGAYVGQGPSMTTAGIPWGTPVPGPGRSFQIAVQFDL